MMGQREDGQRQFFYAFDLDKVVPPDHLVRQIESVIDLSWVHKELAPYYSDTGRPSIDPVLMIRMLIVGLRVCDPLRAAGKLLTPARPRACIEQCERNCMSPSVGPVRRSGSTARRNGRSLAWQ